MHNTSRTVIVGLGKTGLSCARFLARRGIPFAVIDSRAEPPCLAGLRAELPETPVFTGGFNAQALAQAEQLVISPGVSPREPALARALARGVPVIGDIELFARHAHAPIVAITGANGKSTVTTWIGNMARHAGWNVRVGGNLGTPALDLLGDRDARVSKHHTPAPSQSQLYKKEPDLYVLELSSFQLETTSSLNPTAAVVLNISPDHMDRYNDVAAYAAAKQRVYRGNGVMVINKDDPWVMRMREKGRKCIYFGFDEPMSGDFGLRDVGDVAWLARGKEALMPYTELGIHGAHNVANALAALALGEALRLPRASMLAGLREFRGLPHRTQWIAEHGSVQWYNDSKGTNVGATMAALQGLATTSGTSGKVVLIAGGDGKGADFSPLRPLVREHARVVILIGRDAPLIEAALMGTVLLVYAATMEDAVRQAVQMAHEGDVVLLSPACASFDMYSNYEERGRAFIEAVHVHLGAGVSSPRSSAR